MSTSTGPAGPPAGPAGSVPEDAQLWLIRHGETEWSRSGQHTSRTDLPLTEAGVRQAEALRPLVSGLAPALVLSSPRERARRTAELCGLSVDAIDDDLVEWDYGDYEGRTSAEIRQDVPGWTLWSRGAPGGESAEQVQARADRVLTRARAALADGPVVLVAHGHICRVLGARWIGLGVEGGAHLLLGTAAPSLLSWQYGTPVIEHWNMTHPSPPDRPTAHPSVPEGGHR